MQKGLRPFFEDLRERELAPLSTPGGGERSRSIFAPQALFCRIPGRDPPKTRKENRFSKSGFFVKIPGLLAQNGSRIRDPGIHSKLAFAVLEGGPRGVK